MERKFEKGAGRWVYVVVFGTKWSGYFTNKQKAIRKAKFHGGEVIGMPKSAFGEGAWDYPTFKAMSYSVWTS